MTEYQDSLGKFFVGDLVGVGPRLLEGGVKLAYVHLDAQPSLHPPQPSLPLALPHLAFASQGERFRQRREFNNFLGANENVLRSVHSLLGPAGVLCLRVGAYASAYARLLGDEIFGDDAFVNEIPMRSPEAALRHGRFSTGHAQDETILMFARDVSQYQWQVTGTQGATRLQLADLVLHATQPGDLVLTVGETHPLGGVTSRAIALQRRVVVVNRDADLLQRVYASCAGNSQFPVWMGDATAS